MARTRTVTLGSLFQWTTVGRFWGYVGVFLALGTSLAGNVASAKLHTPGEDPSMTEIAFAGLPPLVAFISIELVNHNLWARVPWGKWITRILLFVVAPGSALVSFVHLTLVGLHSLGVVVPTDLQQYLSIATAVLTALLIDGLILGGTAALLLPVEVPVEDEIVDEEPKERPRATTPAHPAWSEWVQFQAKEGREPTGKEMAAMAGVTPGAARSLMSRWRRASEKVSTTP